MYQRKIRLVAIFAVAIVAGAALLSVWAVKSTERHLEQANIAHSLLSEHLQLSVYSYRLFKQLTDEILLGTQANQTVVRNKRASIAESLARIRMLELEQRRALGAAAAPGAVEDTGALEQLIDTIIAEFEALFPLPSGRTRALKVNTILEDRIDISFREAVNAALERQQTVVQRMNQQIDRVHVQLVGASVGLALVAIIGALLVTQVLVRGVSAPLSALQRAANLLGRGELQHRVPRGFDAEFDRMAEAFNTMAAQLSEQVRQREDARRELEQSVLARTRELTQANAALQRADTVRRHFFADVSHELRTPLTIIRGEAQVALRGKDRDDADYRDALSSILDQSIGLSRLVEDMLFIARADAQTIRLNRRHVDPLQLSRDVIKDVRQLAHNRRIDLKLEAPEGTELQLLGDPDRLRQLLLILLDNAIRHSPDGQEILVQWGAAKDCMELRIVDYGQGIDAEDLPYIFDRFFRGHGQNEAPAGNGLGLGLAVAKAIVTAHNGSIQASSAPQQGTQFLLRFPQDKDAA